MDDIKNILQGVASDTEKNTKLRCMVLQSVSAVTKNDNQYYSYIEINGTWIVMKPDGAVSIANKVEINEAAKFIVCMKIYTT